MNGVCFDNIVLCERNEQKLWRGDCLVPFKACSLPLQCHKDILYHPPPLRLNSSADGSTYSEGGTKLQSLYTSPYTWPTPYVCKQVCPNSLKNEDGLVGCGGEFPVVFAVGWVDSVAMEQVPRVNLLRVTFMTIKGLEEGVPGQFDCPTMCHGIAWEENGRGWGRNASAETQSYVGLQCGCWCARKFIFFLQSTMNSFVCGFRSSSERHATDHNGELGEHMGALDSMLFSFACVHRHSVDKLWGTKASQSRSRMLPGKWIGGRASGARPGFQIRTVGPNLHLSGSTIWCFKEYS